MKRIKSHILRKQLDPVAPPTPQETALTKEANAMSNRELAKCIKTMRSIAAKANDQAINFKIMVFEQVYAQRDDCGPGLHQVRVRSTS